MEDPEDIMVEGQGDIDDREEEYGIEVVAVKVQKKEPVKPAAKPQAVNLVNLNPEEEKKEPVAAKEQPVDKAQVGANEALVNELKAEVRASNVEKTEL